MAYWHKIQTDGWSCPDCGSREHGWYHCEACAERTAVLVTMSDGRIVEVEHDGDVDAARQMVDRHYPQAVEAWMTWGGKRVRSVLISEAGNAD